MYNRKQIKKALAAFDSSPILESTAWTREMNREWRYVAIENALRAYGLPEWNAIGEVPLPPTGTPIFIYNEKSDTVRKSLTHPDMKVVNPDVTHWMLYLNPTRPKPLPANYVARRNKNK